MSPRSRLPRGSESRVPSLREAHGLPTKDLPILAVAVASLCPVLLTGDIADFGHLIGRTIEGIRVLKVRMLLVELSTAD